MGGFVEPISSCNGIPTVYLNGVVATGGYAVDQGAGVIAFDAAPGAGVAITATFSFSFRCRFLSDILDFNNFMLKLWELKKLQFVSVK